MAKKKIRTLSLFSGAGGLDIGFHQAAFDIVAAVEIEKAYCETLRANIGRNHFFGPSTKVFCEDIRTFDPRPFKNQRIECVIGGPPCQTFSAAGRRSGGVVGTADARGQLFQTYCSILKEIRPKAFLFENVYGLTGANDGKPWRQIQQAFSELGYTLRCEVIDAADFGVPQHRERLIIVGSRDGEFEFPIPTHGPDSNTGTALTSVLDAIGDLQKKNEPFHEGLGGLYGHLLPLVPEGLNYAFFTAEMGHPEPVFAWRSKFHDLLYKVNRYEPCRTIKAQPGKFTGPFHWKNRHFTEDELKRLQSFPDEYTIIGGYNTVVEQIGNSVPPKLAFALATSLREQLFDRKKSLTLKTRPFGFQSTFRQRQRERTNRFKVVAAAEIARRYGKNKTNSGRSIRKDESYFVRANGLFDRRKYASLEKIPSDPAYTTYEVKVAEAGSEIEIEFGHVSRQPRTSKKSAIEVTGLSKYLGRLDRLSVDAVLRTPNDIFCLWRVIEEVLTQRSRFFTLIDIYGHYANRGDTIRVASELDWGRDDDLYRAINYFSQSENCGDFISLNSLHRTLDIETKELKSIIQNLREIRFDVRTDETHPIIGSGRTICTYPFPLLSPKALVESKVQLSKSTNQPNLF